MTTKVDYLVVGSGASALAFVDVMLQETDATFAMIDRRAVPGGHWNDAYPFVRLHQPSAFYGVASKSLGRNRIDTAGLNKGFYELASGVEIVNYYHSLMADEFLPSGRVHYFPLCEYSADGAITSTLSGERHDVDYDTFVDATKLTTSVPLTHTRRFEVADGVRCVPPNDLPRLAPNHARVTVLGAGKTGIDSITWLLGNGFPPGAITWVMPRDSWLINRANIQPGFEFFEFTVGGLAKQYEIIAGADSVDAICTEFEEAGIWLRMSKDVWPTMFHAATVAEAEVDAMRRIDDVVRLGRVERIDADRLVLAGGDLAAQPDTLYVDCTASAVAQNVGDQTPVFGSNTIALQMIRPYQPCFSSALIAHITVAIDAAEQRNQLAQPTPMTDTVDDWLRVQAAGMTNQFYWSQTPAIADWMASCRLNGFGGLVAAEDEARKATLTRLMQFAPAALQNLAKLAGRDEGA